VAECLAAAIQNTQLPIQDIQLPTGADPIARGRFLLSELTAVLAFYFDDGVEDEKDAQLARVDAEHEDDPQTADALAAALDNYATLAVAHRKELDGLGGFEASYIAKPDPRWRRVFERFALSAQRNACTFQRKVEEHAIDRVAMRRCDDGACGWLSL
jgi:hypothetical protein